MPDSQSLFQDLTMNYVGHAYLAGGYGHFMLGQFLGDHWNRGYLAETPSELMAGVKAHHALDRFTDAHPAFRKGFGILSQLGAGRFAGVVMDVLTDYFLVNNADYWAERSFCEFRDGVYESLRVLGPSLPGRMAVVAERILARDHLNDYKSLDGMRFVSRRLASRSSRPECFDGVAEAIVSHGEVLAGLTSELFVDALAQPVFRKLASHPVQG